MHDARGRVARSRTGAPSIVGWTGLASEAFRAETTRSGFPSWMLAYMLRRLGDWRPVGVALCQEEHGIVAHTGNDMNRGYVRAPEGPTSVMLPGASFQFRKSKPCRWSCTRRSMRLWLSLLRLTGSVLCGLIFPPGRGLLDGVSPATDAWLHAAGSATMRKHGQRAGRPRCASTLRAPLMDGSCCTAATRARGRRG